MNIKRSKIKTQLLLYYIGLYLISHLLVFFISLVVFGKADSQRLAQLSFPGHIAVIIIFPILYYIHLSVFSREISADDEISVRRINQTPLHGAILLAICILFTPLFIMAAAIWLKIIVSVYQGIYFAMIGIMLSLSFSLVLFYKSKVQIYKLRSIIKISSLSLFHKILIPIMCTIMITFYLASSGLYYQNSSSIFSMYSKEIAAKIESNSSYIASFFGSVRDQLMTLSHSDGVINGNIDEIVPMLERMASTKSEYVQSFMYAGLDGQAIDNVGTKVNVKGRSYYDKTLLTGKPVISDPIISKRDGKTIVIIAYPVIRGNVATGIVASAITIDGLHPIMQRDTIMSSGRFMVITREGKIFYHKDAKLVGQTIGKEIKDDGTNIISLMKIVSEPVKTFYDYTFGGLETMSYKIEIPGIERWLVFSFEKRDLVEPLKPILIQMTVVILLVVLIISGIIYYIARSFSVPIHNTIMLINNLAKGDLTVENKITSSDELGELIDLFSLFQKKLRDILNQMTNASIQLSSSSEELASTSVSLSESAQSQAASIEEASASIVEVSGSIETINNSAKEQAELAKKTYCSMDELQRDNETVVAYAGEALTAARGSTEQANIGQKLMISTIDGMNKIDESTKKIAETVLLITDISDKVNLLALNASIEAARAGEHGRGFAVVAEEISALADQTAQSAKTINMLVQDGLVEVNQGRRYVDATNNALNNIISFIAQTEKLAKQIADSSGKQGNSSSLVLNDTKKVMEMADAVSSATGEQMTTNLEMSKMIEHINLNTQSNAAAAEEIASSAEEISAQAESMRTQMGFFKL